MSKKEMNRREFVRRTAAFGTVSGFGFSTILEGGEPPSNRGSDLTRSDATYYVASDGKDENPGTRKRPFATVGRARDVVRKLRRPFSKPVHILLRQGTYYLPESLILGAQDSGSPRAPVIYAAYPGEQVTLSGGRKLSHGWKPYRDGIWQCTVPRSLYFTQLFVNGKRQICARYPNYDRQDPLVSGQGYINAAGPIPAAVTDPHPGPNEDMTFSGSAPRGVLFDPATFTRKRWAKPQEAVIHILQAYYWGNLMWQLKGVDWANHRIWFGRGGWQLGAKWSRNPCEVNQHSRFYVENVFEELDAPGEWYLDHENSALYYKPEEAVNLKKALVEAPVLEEVVRFEGTQEKPVHDVVLSGFRIAHSTSTFLKEYDAPSLSDWSIHRGGAVFLEGARDCTVENCWFDAVGGNGTFLNDYNRSNKVTGCKFTEGGDSAICMVGSLDSTLGTRRDFPYECEASNNLIHDCGVYGKQIAGVYISRAKRITAAHNLIYNLPRAGICIGDGTWGGHVIEYNHIHHTVRETLDHGPFNAWGRDRYWSLAFSQWWSAGPDETALPHLSIPAGAVKVDVMDPIVIRNNFFRAESPGWGIDIDDGGSNYHIYNNLCIGMSVKFRDGDDRLVENNIFVNPFRPPQFGTSNENAENRFLHNIVVVGPQFDRGDLGIKYDPQKTTIFCMRFVWPALHSSWIREADYNLQFTPHGEYLIGLRPRDMEEYLSCSLENWQSLGFGRHSVFADPLFVDPKNNDYRVKAESPAAKLGFKNFEMGAWGITNEFPAEWRESGRSMEGAA